ncbi:DUF4097 family beta strand repeat-containing protein [Glycomyces salinus]|uniref:DUF4097 family beta strand repeat-containing protein n=1 Tax=Glycomyces salinus TaxID=980294 RepID=UPI0018ED7ED5|nr:DUF4097 family beta strand repeat-containing protein [Glycomyces salinus]
MTTLQQEAPPERPDRTGRRAWWIVGGALTAVVMLISLITAGVWTWTSVSPVSSDSHTEVHPGPVSGVDLDVSNGHVDLTAAAGPDLEVRRDTTWQGPEPGIDEQLRPDGTFTARAICGDNLPFWINTEECEVDYSLGVPAGADAVVRTTLAGVEADGLDGELDLDVSHGHVEARNLRATATSVHAGHGDVDLSFDEVRGDIDVTANFGDVTILVPDDGTTYDVRSDSDFGSEFIDIATDPEAEADYIITVDYDFGGLEVRYTT